MGKVVGKIDMDVGKVSNISFKGTSAKAASEAVSEAVIDAKDVYDTFVRRKELSRQLLKSMPKSMSIMDKLNALSGEVPNICINALGTAFVAPIFIKYNFLSKTDEDTRTYSAWRQPISAVLAVITQAGILVPINKMIMHASNEGMFVKLPCNKTMLQDEKHIAAVEQKKYKERNNGAKMPEKELKAAVLERRNEQISKMVESLKKNNTIEYTANGETVRMSPEEIKDVLASTTDGLISNIKANMTRYSEEKLQFKVQRADYYRTNHKDVVAEFEAVEKQLAVRKFSDEAEQKLVGCKDLEFIKKQKDIAARKDHEVVLKSIKARIKQLQKDGKDGELVEILKDLSCKPDNKSMRLHLKKNYEAIQEYAGLSSYKAVFEEVAKKVAETIEGAEKELRVLEKVKGMIKSGKDIRFVRKAGTEDGILDVIIRELNVKGSNEKVEVKNEIDFLYEVIQKVAKNADKNVKGFTQSVGLVVSLAMLPFTCMLLNYLYPKFMNVAFPKLAKAKKEKTDNQLEKNNQVAAVVQSIDATTTKQEVKS